MFGELNNVEMSIRLKYRLIEANTTLADMSYGICEHRERGLYSSTNDQPTWFRDVSCLTAVGIFAWGCVYKDVGGGNRGPKMLEWEKRPKILGRKKRLQKNCGRWG